MGIFLTLFVTIFVVYYVYIGYRWYTETMIYHPFSDMRMRERLFRITLLDDVDLVDLADRTKLVRVPFLLPTWAAAQCWRRTILVARSFHNPYSRHRTIAHELAHSLQWLKFGVVDFVLLYLLESVVNGYRNNAFEVHARLMERKMMARVDIHDIDNYYKL